MSLFNLTYSCYKYNVFHLLKLLDNQNGTNFHSPCIVSIALLVCCWNTAHQTKHFSIIWLEFHFNMPFVLLLFLVEALFRQPAAFFLFFKSLIWFSFSSASFSGVSVQIAAILLLVWFFLCFRGAALGCGLTNSGEQCNVRFTKSGFTLSDWSATWIRAE